jgi:hypothetical protein
LETIKLKGSLSSNHSNKWAGKEMAVPLDNKTQLEEHFRISLHSSLRMHQDFNRSLGILHYLEILSNKLKELDFLH